MALIKRYPNRKYYDTRAGRYITLEEIAALVRSGEDVKVVEHPSGVDISAQTLLQAVLAEQKRLGELFPRVVLTYLLRTSEERLDSVRSRLLAAFDPDRFLEETLRERLDHLVQRGDLAFDEAERVLASLFPVRPVRAEDPGQNVEDLRRRLEQLENELAALRDRAVGKSQPED